MITYEIVLESTSNRGDDPVVEHITIDEKPEHNSTIDNAIQVYKKLYAQYQEAIKNGTYSLSLRAVNFEAL